MAANLTRRSFGVRVLGLLMGSAVLSLAASPALGAVVTGSGDGAPANGDTSANRGAGAVEDRPRFVLCTIHEDYEDGEVEAGLVDEKGGLWFVERDHMELDLPDDLVDRLEYLRVSPLLKSVGKLERSDLDDLLSLIGAVESQSVNTTPGALDAGYEESYAIQYGKDGSCTPVLLGMSGGVVFENTDEDAQSLYYWLRRTFDEVAHYEAPMGPEGPQPIPIVDFCELDAQAISNATIEAFYMDCEEGPRKDDSFDADDAEEIRELVLYGYVVRKASNMETTGDTMAYSFCDANGEEFASLTFYRGMLDCSSGMYEVSLPGRDWDDDHDDWDDRDDHDDWDDDRDDWDDWDDDHDDRDDRDDDDWDDDRDDD